MGLMKIVVEGVAVVEFGMDYGSGDGGGSFEIDEEGGSLEKGVLTVKRHPKMIAVEEEIGVVESE
jgi:hypothetical protein